jgi:nitrile hydratase
MTPAFRVGDRVRIDDRYEPRHHRTPAYVKGKVGEVERICLAHGRPEILAYRNDGGPPRTVYRVRLRQRDLWPDYDGPAHDTLEIEIFEHWLRPVEARN